VRIVPRSLSGLLSPLIPNSMLARTAWVLGLGIAIVVVDSILIATLIVREKSSPSSITEIAAKIKTITSLMSALPDVERNNVLSYMDDEEISTAWHDKNQPVIIVGNEWGTAHLSSRIKRYLQPLPLLDVYVSHRRLMADQGEAGSESDRVFVTLKLNDGTWLEHQVYMPHHHQQWIVRIVGVITIFIISVYVLALLVTRQVIKPLKRFSSAAMQFSTDINALPIEEQGPTEIKQAVAAFNVMQERISRFVNERMQMIAAISHDLKTPITRLILRMESIPDEAQKQKILQDLNEMQAMLESTLAFARDDASKEEKTQVDLAALIQSVCSDMVDAGWPVYYEGPLHVNCDCRPLAIRRVLNNLIDNAVKYGQQATVTLTDSDNGVEVSIADRGPGIPVSERENVFASFYRLEKSRNRDTGGTGLGLTVARTIVRSHGGEIVLKDRGGGGLMVVVRLPA